MKGIALYMNWLYKKFKKIVNAISWFMIWCCFAYLVVAMLILCWYIYVILIAAVCIAVWSEK
jgi:hypothetical protein